MKDKKIKKQEFWQSPRGKAIKKLIGWSIFFGILFIFLALESPIQQEVNDNKTPALENEQFVLYSQMLKELANNNYAYRYNIKIGDQDFLLEGNRDGKQDLGTLENSNNMFRYIINEDGIFKINLKKKEAIEKLDDLLDAKILDIGTFLANHKNTNYKVQKEGETRQIIYNIEDYDLVVKTDLKHIIQVEYKKGIDIYTLEFSQMGEIQEIELSE